MSSEHSPRIRAMLPGPAVFTPAPGDNGQAEHDRPPFRVSDPTLPGRVIYVDGPLPTEKVMLLPTNPVDRKNIPIGTGVLDYFPLALAEVARVSKAGNDQHHPGTPLHWDKTKSLDHADCIPRHFIDRFSRDTDGQRHMAKLAWRALAMLETYLETEAKP